MPSVGKVNKVLEAKGVQNLSKITTLQAISNARAKEVGRAPARMPGFHGNLSLLPRAPAARR